MAISPRVILVTGASSGFGRTVARHLHDLGHRVYGTSRRPGEGANPHGAFALLGMDVTDTASVEAAIATLIAREGRLDAVVSNAGMGITGSIEDTSDAEAFAQFDTNFFGNHRVVRAALPHLRARATAHLIVIGSLGGLFGLPFQGFYSATKFALEGYCESLRLELRHTPVRVSILEPGDFATGFTGSRVRIAGAGPGSPYHAAFERALQVIEEAETAGADPMILARAVAEILDADRPPLRRAVVGAAQEDLARAKYDLSPDDLETALADWFEGDAPADATETPR